jgi:glycosyltransferase involved in cell wall biosynthesis
MPIRLSISSNSPWANTGYGGQVRTFAPRLKALDCVEDVALIAWWGLEGGMLGGWNGMRVYPKGFHPYGSDVMGAHSQHFGADLLITLIDAWVLNPKEIPPGLRWSPWFPIDSEPVPPPVLNVVKEAWKPLVYSRFGQRMMEDAGVECTYIPHGIDRTFFQPMNQDAARERLGWPKDRYIVGMVAANKDRPSRKAFTANLAAFAAFQKDHPDAMLYLHTQMTDRVGGENLAALIESLGITNVMAPDPYGLLLGYGDDHMATLYSAFDVLLSVSMGEGFSMTPLEAQSCGTPVIVGQWTATEELLFGGWGVDKADTEPFWTPLGAWQRIPHVGAIKEALDDAWRGDREQMGRLGELGAAEFDADLVTQTYWRPFLESVEKAIEVNKTITGAAAENGGEDKLKAKLNKKLAAA